MIGCLKFWAIGLIGDMRGSGKLKRLRKKVLDQRNRWSAFINTFKVKGKAKIFCIGRNKTGTTSLKKAFEDLGFVVGNQRKAELLLHEYISGNFQAVIDYCRTAQVFQDVPFSYPETYKHLDQAYPGSKFILSVRDSPEQWYQSLLKFHSIKFGEGKTPTSEDLGNARYVWKGWIKKAMEYSYNTPENDPYNKEILINHYISYNNAVAEYFKFRPDDLIVINLSETGSYQRLMKFLDIKSPYDEFPWENRVESL